MIEEVREVRNETSPLPVSSIAAQVFQSYQNSISPQLLEQIGGLARSYQSTLLPQMLAALGTTNLPHAPGSTPQDGVEATNQLIDLPGQAPSGEAASEPNGAGRRESRIEPGQPETLNLEPKRQKRRRKEKS